MASRVVCFDHPLCLPAPQYRPLIEDARIARTLPSIMAVPGLGNSFSVPD